jgi:hypothetical protein
MMNKPIVWYVDEDETQSKTYVNELRMLLPQSIEVMSIYPPLRQKEDYLSILENPETACLVLDQRLKDAGTANYSGIGLAHYLRGVNQKIPIYILTNFARDDSEKAEFSSKGWSVEQIIDKGKLNNEEYAQQIAARILRHINVYGDILDQREARFRDLLQRSVKETLSEDEKQELSDLQFERFQVTLANESSEQQGLEKLIEVNEQLLDLLNQHTKE